MAMRLPASAPRWYQSLATSRSFSTPLPDLIEIAQPVLGRNEALRRGALVPGRGRRIVLRHGAAFGIDGADLELGARIAIGGRLAQVDRADRFGRQLERLRAARHWPAILRPFSIGGVSRIGASSGRISAGSSALASSAGGIGVVATGLVKPIGAAGLIDPTVEASTMSMTRGLGCTMAVVGGGCGLVQHRGLVRAAGVPVRSASGPPGGRGRALAAFMRCMTRFSASIETATRAAVSSSGRRWRTRKLCVSTGSPSSPNAASGRGLFGRASARVGLGALAGLTLFGLRFGNRLDFIGGIAAASAGRLWPASPAPGPG